MSEVVVARYLREMVVAVSSGIPGNLYGECQGPELRMQS